MCFSMLSPPDGHTQAGRESFQIIFFKFSTQETHKRTASPEKRCWSAQMMTSSFPPTGKGRHQIPWVSPLGLNIDKLISLQVRVEISKTSPGFCHDVCCFPYKWLILYEQRLLHTHLKSGSFFPSLKFIHQKNIGKKQNQYKESQEKKYFSV